MKLRNGFCLVVLFTLATVSTGGAATGNEVATYLKVLDTGSSTEIIVAAKRISSAGYVDSAVYSKIATILKDNYASVGNDPIAVDEMSWLCKALSSSGMQEYKLIVSEVARNSKNGKLRGYAQRSLDMFEEYAERNQIMSVKEGNDHELSQEDNRLINMLRSDKVLLVRDASKTIFRSLSTDDKVYDVAAEVLVSLYAAPPQHRATRDTLAWLCKALGHSGEQKYRPVLEQIVNEERNILNKDDMADGRLMRYAQSSLKMLI
jgi:hypothetical protein